MNLSQIKHALRIKYGLGDFEPTDSQLRSILEDCPPGSSEGAIDAAIRRHCTTVGKHKFAAEDLTDLADALQNLRSAMEGE